MTALLFLGLLGLAQAGSPRVGESVPLSFTRRDQPIAGAPLRVVAPAGAVDAEPATVGTTDATGLVSWTPTVAGIVRLEVGKQESTVLVAPAPGSAPAAAFAGLLCLALPLGLGLAVARAQRRSR